MDPILIAVLTVFGGIVCLILLFWLVVWGIVLVAGRRAIKGVIHEFNTDSDGANHHTSSRYFK